MTTVFPHQCGQQVCRDLPVGGRGAGGVVTFVILGSAELVVRALPGEAHELPVLSDAE